MRKIAERYIAELESTERPNKAEALKKAKDFHYKYSFFIVLGLLSITLYLGLYFFNADLIALTRNTYQGSKGLFFVPILLALVFSVIHGAFTAKFWDLLGVKAKS
ncbi:hypothetical protein MNBD_GAMMA12-3632 [hydrothermal vent metagenome]|uniref:DUF485 domain-containing protein n=1 Tax=hydrothermal vent metagenome TaxID=652676 RepID=A0A3B0Y985_9ZZZZ